MDGAGFLDGVDIGMTTEMVCLFFFCSNDGWVEISFAGTKSGDGFVKDFASGFLDTVGDAFFEDSGLASLLGGWLLSCCLACF
jgi:hypothetical protein